MNKPSSLRIRVVLWAAVSTAAWAYAPARAQAGGRVAADVGMAFAQDRFGENTGPALAAGASGFYSFDALRLSVGAGVFTQSYESVRLISDPYRFETTLRGLVATVEYAFAATGERVTPFVGASGGRAFYAYDWSRGEQSGHRDGGGLLLAPHAGLRVLVTPAVGVEVGARYLYARTARINYGDRFVEDHVAGMTVRAGATVLF